jgi:hypothetical protein
MAFQNGHLFLYIITFLGGSQGNEEWDVEEELDESRKKGRTWKKIKTHEVKAILRNAADEGDREMKRILKEERRIKNPLKSLNVQKLKIKHLKIEKEYKIEKIIKNTIIFWNLEATFIK